MPSPLTLPMRYTRRKPPLGAPLRRRPRGLAAFLPVNEGGGGRLRDATRNGHDATLSGGGTWGASPYGRALTLDGTTGSLTLDASAALNPTGGLHLWCLVRVPNAAGGVQVFHCRWASSAPRAYVFYLTTTNLVFQMDSAGQLLTLNSATPSSALSGGWHDLRATWDGATAGIWIDGKLDAQASFAGPMYTLGSPTLFGQFAGTDWLAGSVAGLSVGSLAPSPAEVRSLYVAPYSMF